MLLFGMLIERGDWRVSFSFSVAISTIVGLIAVVLCRCHVWRIRREIVDIA